jgi:quinol monooxygenase YgiN
MAPATEIMYFKASPSYIKDPSPMIAELTATSSGETLEGLLKAYIGFETEDPNNAFWVFEWVSQDAHNVHRGTDSFKATQAIATRQVFASKPISMAVNFSDTSRIFSAPVTEFVTFTLKEGVSMDQLQPLVTQLEAQLEGTPNFYGSSWAPVNEKPNVIHGVLGWESVEAHWEAVSSGPLKETIDKVKEVADLWLVHAILKQSNW